MTWIVTCSGKKIDFLEPDPDQIDILDIAHALSVMPRFTGHTLLHYTVAQHSYEVSRQCSPENQLVGFAHDFTEAYIGDISKPLKSVIGNVIEEIEHRLWQAIAARFGLPTQIPDEVKEVDARMLFTEKRDFLTKRGPKWGWEKEPYPEPLYRWFDRRNIVNKFLSRWNELTPRPFCFESQTTPDAPSGAHTI